MERIAGRGVAATCLVLAAMALAGCNGGSARGEGNPLPETPSRVLSWEVPTEFQDESRLDPCSDLDRYLVYVNTTGVFSEGDVPADNVSCIVPGTPPVPRSSYDIGNLARRGVRLLPGVTHYVSLRVVARTGEASPFTTPTSFIP